MADTEKKTTTNSNGLTTVRIDDFRCIEEVTLDLRDIVALKGNNESGKTSIIKALEFLMLGGGNAGKYVRSGCRDFRVAGYVESADKTVIRTARGYKIYAGNVVDKADEKGKKPLIVIDKLKGNETPEQVAKIFNTHRNSVTGGMIGSRGYNGVIPFVQTSAAENYSIVSEEMGVKPFRDAAYGGILEAYRLDKKAKILAEQLDSLKRKKTCAEEAVSKAEEMENILGDRAEIYDAMLKALESLTEIEEITSSLNGKSTEAPESIDEMLVDITERVRVAISEFNRAKWALNNLPTKGEAPEPIDVDLLQCVAAIQESARHRKECKAKLAEGETMLEKATDEIKQYGDEITVCPVCGAVLVDGKCQGGV